MKVRLTTDRAGFGFEQREGEIIDVSDDEALLLVERGQAEFLDGTENAAELLPAGRGRKGRKVEKR